jgi:GMP synthase-like glutamine amidotransferase
MSTEEILESVPAAKLTPRRVHRSKQRGRLPRRRPAGRALLLQGADLAPDAALGEALRAHAVEPTMIRIERGAEPPDPGSLDLAVVIGPARWSGDPGYEAGSRHVDWLREANRAGTPVLAVGTASQLLATALGGGVDRARRPRHGWIRVRTAAPELIAPGPWLAWEDATIRLPPGAELLAHDRVGLQAFRVGRQVGVQFHPEATPQLLTDWVANSDATFDHQGIMEAAWRDQAAALAVSRRLYRSFVRSAMRPRR